MSKIIERKDFDDVSVVLKTKADGSIRLIVSACGGYRIIYSADTADNGRKLYNLFVHWITNTESFDVNQIEHPDSYREFVDGKWDPLTN